MVEIEGKVAQILDQYTLVLNVGSSHGVKKGMKFVIFELGENIKDPSNNEDIGNLEIVKGFVEVVNVQVKMCTVQSSETQTESQLTMFSLNRQITSRVSLPISEKTMDISDKKKIEIGDDARQTN